jgi:putative FmdB family regulatory protein
MPCYTFFCDKCQSKFEIVSSIREYNSTQQCPSCKSSKHTNRSYIEDVATLNSSIKKSDNELKTIGDLANRNRDKMSEDHKQSLYEKHNEYKDHKEDTPLPKGMTRLKKQKKIKWT